jgi:hypothetical protein
MIYIVKNAEELLGFENIGSELKEQFKSRSSRNEIPWKGGWTRTGKRMLVSFSFCRLYYIKDEIMSENNS